MGLVLVVPFGLYFPPVLHYRRKEIGKLARSHPEQRLIRLGRLTVQAVQAEFKADHSLFLCAACEWFIVLSKEKASVKLDFEALQIVCGGCSDLKRVTIVKR